MENLIYIAVVLFLIALGAGSIYFKRKLNITEKEVELAKMILDVVNFISTQFEYKYKANVSTVVKYCFEALEFIKEYEGLEGDYSYKLDLIQDKALDLLVRNGITIDDGVDEVVERIVEYIYAEYVLTK